MIAHLRSLTTRALSLVLVISSGLAQDPASREINTLTELEKVSFNSDSQVVKFALHNLSDEFLSAWEIELTGYYPNDESRSTSVIFDSAGAFNPQGGMEGVQPGATRTFEVRVPLSRDLQTAVDVDLQASMILFERGRGYGNSVTIGEVLEARQTRFAELDFWLREFQTVAEDGGSVESISRCAEKLAQHPQAVVQRSSSRSNDAAQSERSLVSSFVGQAEKLLKQRMRNESQAMTELLDLMRMRHNHLKAHLPRLSNAQSRPAEKQP